jgi:hypothetical protein
LGVLDAWQETPELPLLSADAHGSIDGATINRSTPAYTFHPRITPLSPAFGRCIDMKIIFSQTAWAFFAVKIYKNHGLYIK